MARDSFHEKGGIGGIIGRTLKAPSNIAKGLGFGKLTQGVRDKVKENVGDKLKGAGSSLRERAEANMQGGFGSRLKGRLQNMLADRLEKLGDKTNKVADKGLLGALGDKIEKQSIKVGKEYLDSIYTAKERELYENKHGAGSWDRDRMRSSHYYDRNADKGDK